MEHSWNEEIYDDLAPPDYEGVRVYSRDWTVDTILNQIKKENINLNPRFQRRNAWTDQKRSRLIESILLNVPIPEIILAEDPSRRGSFVVIDGKQRLLTLQGFTDPQINYWSRPTLSGIRPFRDVDLNGIDYATLDSKYPDYHRQFLNRDIRCTVVTYDNNSDVLYDIFYRMNSGAVPLSMQELRHALYRGGFSDRLIEVTDSATPLHDVIGGKAPDPRLRDAELLLRLVAIELRGGAYQGNLKNFLDQSLQAFNASWGSGSSLNPVIQNIFNGISKAILVMGADRVGRKFKRAEWESRFNRSVFEAEIYYFCRIDRSAINDETAASFVSGFESLCENDPDFLASIEATTKTKDSYSKRYGAIRDLANSAFGVQLTELPIM